VGDLLRIGAVIAVAVIACALLIRFGLRGVVGPVPAASAARAATVPPPPRLQADPHADLVAAQAAQRIRLSGWAWTDATHRYARIPIGRAMQIEAERQDSVPASPASP
jgi:hypothetical protein